MEIVSWLPHTIWFGNSAKAWVLAAIGAALGFIVVYGVLTLLGRRLQQLAERRPHSVFCQTMAAATVATRAWVLLLLAIVVALHGLTFKASLEHALHWAVVALVGAQIAFWLSKLVTAWLRRATPEGSMQHTNPIIYGILTTAIEMTVWVTLALILLAQAGVHIGAFVASLGVGGIAIAMAAKNVLEDLLASIAIGLDKPFEVGQYIAFGSDQGTVTKVGVKTTRIASLSGEELIISNSNLLQQLVHNYSRRHERRVVFGFYAPLDTPRDKVEAVAAAVNAIILATDKTRLDRGHFLAIEPAGYRYEFVYYVLDTDYKRYCDIQQAINLAILEQQEALGIAFALPARMIHTAS